MWGRRAIAAGYKIAELHRAPGDLIHSFLLALSNKRKNAYGGDLAGWMRLALEVIEAVRAVCPDDLTLFFRTSTVDGDPEGWTQDDTVVLSRQLKVRGVDVMDCSSNAIAGSAKAGARRCGNRGSRFPTRPWCRKMPRWHPWPSA